MRHRSRSHEEAVALAVGRVSPMRPSPGPGPMSVRVPVPVPVRMAPEAQAASMRRPRTSRPPKREHRGLMATAGRLELDPQEANVRLIEGHERGRGADDAALGGPDASRGPIVTCSYYYYYLLYIVVYIYMILTKNASEMDGL